MPRKPAIWIVAGLACTSLLVLALAARLGSNLKSRIHRELAMHRAAICSVSSLLPGCSAAGKAAPGASEPLAGPYLMSDPYPSKQRQPNHFLVTCDGNAPVSSTPAVSPDGTRYLYFSLARMATGEHTCRVAAADVSNNLTGAVSLSFTLP